MSRKVVLLLLTVLLGFLFDPETFSAPLPAPDAYCPRGVILGWRAVPFFPGIFDPVYLDAFDAYIAGDRSTPFKAELTFFDDGFQHFLYDGNSLHMPEIDRCAVRDRDLGTGIWYLPSIGGCFTGNETFYFRKAQLVNVHSHNCIDKRGGEAPGKEVHMWSCSSDNSNQLWEIVQGFRGRRWLGIVGASPGLYLSAKTLEARVYLTRESAGSATTWVFVNGTIRPRERQDLCVDQQWNGTSKGTKLWLWPCDGNSAQIFYMRGNIQTPEKRTCLAQQSDSDSVTTASCSRSSSKQIWQWCF